MANILTANNIIPISSFNKEGASKIFDEVKKNGIRYVFKNNLPECILISPEKYEYLLEEIYDLELYIEATERLKEPDQKLYTQEEVERMFNISKEQLENVEVDIEWPIR